MKHPAIPDHLYSKCAETMQCRDVQCPERAKLGPNGRWYITMGHAAFNSRANNGEGYVLQGDAWTAIVMRLL